MDQLSLRKATKVDVPAIVEMVANDILGKSREDFKVPLPEKYARAFDNIDRDPNQELIVAETGREKLSARCSLRSFNISPIRGV